LYKVYGKKEYKIGPKRGVTFGVMARWGKEIRGGFLLTPCQGVAGLIGPGSQQSTEASRKKERE
jgi:hypothetical protein